MKLVRCILAQEADSQVARLDADARLEPGVRVRLKDSGEPTKLWTVDAVGLLRRENSDVAGRRPEHWFGNDFRRKSGAWESC
jgi:hypothetical protein